ncbi:hypothetical protein BASA81_000232 [Batrachochytrium salamandrivorans]|nr:hypothetical protein BASA81_000232 [Batrachochytrium salamandrivorans]
MQSHQQHQTITTKGDGCRYRTVYEETCRGTGKCIVVESVFRRCAHERNESLLSASTREEDQPGFPAERGFQRQSDPYVDLHGEDI